MVAPRAEYIALWFHEREKKQQKGEWRKQKWVAADISKRREREKKVKSEFSSSHRRLSGYLEAEAPQQSAGNVTSERADSQADQRLCTLALEKTRDGEKLRRMGSIESALDNGEKTACLYLRAIIIQEIIIFKVIFKLMGTNWICAICFHYKVTFLIHSLRKGNCWTLMH